MFCTTLRKRPVWSPIVPMLLKDKATRWREVKLGSHDIAFPLLRPPRPVKTFRISLLTAEDMEAPEGMERVVRLAHLNGGTDVAVLFVVGGVGGSSAAKSMEAFFKLQAEVASEFPMPVIPLATVTDLHETLTSLRGQMAPAIDEPRKDVEAAQMSMLVSRCVVGRPLSDHQEKALGGAVISIQDLAEKTTTLEGQAMLKEVLGERDGARVVDFFLNGPRYL